MKKKIIGAFIMFHLFFIFLQIHKQSYVIELSYQKQKQERLKQELIDQKNALTQELYQQQSPEAIEQFARKEGMRKIALAQVRQIAYE